MGPMVVANGAFFDVQANCSQLIVFCCNY